MMRVLATADLHYNHPKSRGLVLDFARQINDLEFDVLLVVGDTATCEGKALEECLSLFTFPGPKLLLPGNHELWSQQPNSLELLNDQLPRRARAAGWHWLEAEPFILGNVAIVGSIGWYDYSFAPARLGIPHRFYESKVSPGAADHFSEFRHLMAGDDISDLGRQTVARWNDGRYIHLGMTDEQFLHQTIDRLKGQLEAVAAIPTVIAATHHLPFAEILPPPSAPQWDFAKAFLGSPKIGELLMHYPNVKHAVSGHTHMPANAQVGHIQVSNIGSGYRKKEYLLLDV